MARASSKRIASANAARLRQMYIGFAVSHAIFLASRALFGLSRASTVLYVLSTLGSGAVGFALRSVGAPRYDARGVLASEGEDLSAPGVTSLMWDAVWLTWAVHGLVALVSRWFWALYLTIPAYGGYWAWTTIISPRIAEAAAARGADQPPALSKRQAKLQARGQAAQQRAAGGRR